MSWGKVFLEGLLLEAEIGVLDHEHGRRQPLIVDITMEVNTGAPDENDLCSVIDYRVAADHARSLVASGHIELVETFVERLASACLKDTRVIKVTVRARKPDAIEDAEAAGVEIARTQAKR
ncbi:MAG: dihydroneopterin aldolase [Rhodospirillales bacterium]|nr:dihydroneopterin aldolase [Rhodospirillales bacterium]